MIARLRGAWAFWVDTLATREAATALALFRVSIGLLVVHTFGSIVWHDVAGPLWSNINDGGIRDLRASNWLVSTLGGPTPDVVCGLIATTIGAGVLLAAGLGSRVMALVSLQTCMALWSLHPGSGGGHDRLINNALWILVFAESSQTLSVWCRLRTGRWWSDAVVPAWPRYIAIIQIAVVYTATGAQKLGAEWFPWGGLNAVYYALLQPAWARGDTTWAAWVHPLTQMGTVITWVWETTWFVVPLSLLLRARPVAAPGRLRRLLTQPYLRAVYALTGVGMHGTIFVFMEVGPFSWITTSFYLCLWSPDEYRRAWRRLTNRAF